MPRHGGPEVLELARVATPRPSPGEVLIDVRTVGANRQDTFTMAGTANALRIDLPHILGIDPAGVVVALGADVSGIEPGQRVLVKPAIACGSCSFCRAGEDDACSKLQNIGVHRPGGMAEFVAVPATNVFRIPDEMAYAEATAIAHSFPVALQLLKHRMGVRSDDVVLVTGAAGAIGAAVVQLAKLQGATVIAAVGGADRIDNVRSLGPDLIVDYGSEPAFAPLILNAFPDGVSVYVEPAGDERVWQEALRSLGRRARVGVCGAHAGPRVGLDLAWLFRSRATIHGCSGSSLASVREVIDLASKGRLQPAIDSIRPLEDVQAAFQRLAGRQNRGKVILDVAHGAGIDRDDA